MRKFWKEVSSIAIPGVILAIILVVCFLVMQWVFAGVDVQEWLATPVADLQMMDVLMITLIISLLLRK